MIIRRTHTANYTVIGNALFADERLEADEIGVMAYLLSKPNDWEVRRSQLAKRFRLSRERVRRIFTNLIALGWVRPIPKSLGRSGTQITYDVYDEPGEECSLEAAKAALSLGSSGAVQSEAEGEDSSMPDEPSPGGGFQGAGYSRLESAPCVVRDSPSTDSPSTESTKGARAFSEVLEKWPSEKVLSPSVCERLFARLSERDKAACCDGTGPYLDDCRAQKRIVCGLKTYIDERRWEPLVGKTARPASEKAQIRIHSPQWYRWREYRVAMGMKVTFMDDYARSNSRGTWVEPSEWPPALPKAADPATGPPDTLMSEDDLEEMDRQYG